MEYFIGKVSKETGFSVHTLRFYEKKRLISPRRDARNRRIYSKNDLLKLNIIKNFKIIGTPLEDIELYFHFFDNRKKGKEERRIFLQAEKKRINSQIEHLKTIECFIDNILIKCNLLG